MGRFEAVALVLRRIEPLPHDFRRISQERRLVDRVMRDAVCLRMLR